MRSTIRPRSPALRAIRSGAHVRMPLYLPCFSSSMISLKIGRCPASLANETPFSAQLSQDYRWPPSSPFLRSGVDGQHLLVFLLGAFSRIQAVCHPYRNCYFGRSAHGRLCCVCHTSRDDATHPRSLGCLSWQGVGNLSCYAHLIFYARYIAIPPATSMERI